jgi:hypothetical protein
MKGNLSSVRKWSSRVALERVCLKEPRRTHRASGPQRDRGVRRAEVTITPPPCALGIVIESLCPSPRRPARGRDAPLQARRTIDREAVRQQHDIGAAAVARGPAAQAGGARLVIAPEKARPKTCLFDGGHWPQNYGSARGSPGGVVDGVDTPRPSGPSGGRQR